MVKTGDRGLRQRKQQSITNIDQYDFFIVKEVTYMLIVGIGPKWAVLRPPILTPWRLGHGPVPGQ